MDRVKAHSTDKLNNEGRFKLIIGARDAYANYKHNLEIQPGAHPALVITLLNFFWKTFFYFLPNLLLLAEDI